MTTSTPSNHNNGLPELNLSSTFYCIPNHGTHTVASGILPNGIPITVTASQSDILILDQSFSLARSVSFESAFPSFRHGISNGDIDTDDHHRHPLVDAVALDVNSGENEVRIIASSSCRIAIWSCNLSFATTTPLPSLNHSNLKEEKEWLEILPWTVHSTFSTSSTTGSSSNNMRPTIVDLRSDYLLLAGPLPQHGSGHVYDTSFEEEGNVTWTLSLWTLSHSTGIPIWSKVVQFHPPTPSPILSASLDPSKKFLAYLSKRSNLVRILRIVPNNNTTSATTTTAVETTGGTGEVRPSGETTATGSGGQAKLVAVESLWHPEEVRWIGWRGKIEAGEGTISPYHPILFTSSSGPRSAPFRIWSPLIDCPDTFALWSSLQPGGAQDGDADTKGKSRPVRSMWIGTADRLERMMERDRKAMTEENRNGEGSLIQKETGMGTGTTGQLSGGSPSKNGDLFLTWFMDGSVTMTEVFDLDRLVPTCHSQTSYPIISPNKALTKTQSKTSSLLVPRRLLARLEFATVSLYYISNSSPDNDNDGPGIAIFGRSRSVTYPLIARFPCPWLFASRKGNRSEPPKPPGPEIIRPPSHTSFSAVPVAGTGAESPRLVRCGPDGAVEVFNFSKGDDFGDDGQADGNKQGDLVLSRWTVQGPERSTTSSVPTRTIGENVSLEKSVIIGDGSVIAILSSTRLSLIRLCDSTLISSLELKPPSASVHFAEPNSAPTSRFLNLFHLGTYQSLSKKSSAKREETLIAIKSDGEIWTWNVGVENRTPEVEASLRFVSRKKLLELTDEDEEILLSCLSTFDPWTIERNDRKVTTLVLVSSRGNLTCWDYSASTTTPPKEEIRNGWISSGKLSLERQRVRLAAFASDKVALVRSSTTRQEDELTLWDTKESEFASGLEYSEVRPTGSIKSIQFGYPVSQEPVLAVASSHSVTLYAQQRLDHLGQRTKWLALASVASPSTISRAISTFSWAYGAQLLVAYGSHFLLYGRNLVWPATKLQGAQTSNPSLDESVWGTESLTSALAILHGPLPDYHPQSLSQCMLTGKLQLVERIVCALARNYDAIVEGSTTWEKLVDWTLDDYLSVEENAFSTKKQRSDPMHSLLTRDDMGQDPISSVPNAQLSDEEGRALLVKVHERRLPALSARDQAILGIVVQTLLQVKEQRRSLDAHGLRYLISMRSYFIIREYAAKLHQNLELSTVTRLRYRDVVWASHSESQDILLTASTEACGGQMNWEQARALGVFMWLKSSQTIASQLEIVGRVHYMASDDHDPESSSLFFLALKKKRLVQGLWRQSPGHREQRAIIKFLENNFDEPRWKSAALKNAYSLLSKHRFHLAIAFFLLGDSLSDATGVCIRQLDDFQLAIAIARGFEGDDGPVLRNILQKTVIPLALRNGYRFLASWAFWMLNQRDMAIRVIVSPFIDIVKSLNYVDPSTPIGDPSLDDPTLAILFRQFRDWSLQTLKGSYQVAPGTETKFILHVARVLWRMGCAQLALALLVSWEFPPPKQAMIYQDTKVMDPEPTSISSPSSPIFPSDKPLTSPRRMHRRQSSVFRKRHSIRLDLDVPSNLPSRVPSPTYTREVQDKPFKGSSEVDDAELSVFKNVNPKPDTTVPEFDMSAFGF